MTVVVAMATAAAARRTVEARSEHERELTAVAQMTAGVYAAAMADLTRHFTALLRQAEARALEQRRVDLVEFYDHGLYVHRDGTVSGIQGDVGQC